MNPKSVLLQLFVTTYYFLNYYEPVLILLIYAFMLEYAYADITQKVGNKYHFFIFLKFVIVTLIVYLDKSLNLLYIAVTVQAIFVFFHTSNKDLMLNRAKSSYITGAFVVGLILSLLFFNDWKFFEPVNVFLLYPLFALVVLYVKSLEVSDEFCTKGNSKIDFLYRFRFYHISLSFFVIVVFLLTLNAFDNTLEQIFVFTFLLFYLYAQEKTQIKYIRNLQVSVWHFYRIPLMLIILFIGFYLLGAIHFNDDDYKDIALNAFSTITNIAIFNIASLLVLMQLNYQKFGSSYLLLKIIKSPVLVFFTILPTLLIFFNTQVITNQSLQYLPTLFIVIAFSSTIILFIYANIVLETNLLLKSLFVAITDSDFKSYKKHIIFIEETKIDSVLKIVTNVINNNDTATSHSLFYHLACWTKLNIESIDQRSFTYRDRLDNRFYDFFKIIINNISTSSNIVIHQNFILSFQNIVFRDINHENYFHFRILYDVLNEYLLLMLNKKEDQIAINIYQTIYFNCGKIFLHLPAQELQDWDMVRSSKDFNRYKEFFVEKASKIIDAATKNKNIEFLKRMDLYEDLFIEEFDDRNASIKKWDGKVLDLFLETSADLIQREEFLIDNNVFVSVYITHQYDIFMPYINLSDLNEKYIYSDRLENYVLRRLEHIFLYAIDKNQLESDFSLEILWTQLLAAIRNEDIITFKKYLTFFSYISNRLFEKVFKLDNHYVCEAVWRRFLQILHSIKERRTLLDEEFMTYLNEKMTILKKKFPQLEDFNDDRQMSKKIRDMDIFSEYRI